MGIHLTNPLSKLHDFSLKTQLLEATYTVPTMEGLTVELDAALLFHVDKSAVKDIFVNLGKDYRELVIEPEVSSMVRAFTSEAEASALYTCGRTDIQQKLEVQLTKSLAARGIIVEQV